AQNPPQDTTYGNPPPVPMHEITVGGMGTPDVNGYVATKLPPRKEININVKASGQKQYWFQIDGKKHKLVSQCASPYPTDRARTNIGVGEQLTLQFSPALPLDAEWSTSGGLLSTNLGKSVVFTAPDRANKVTISAVVKGLVATKQFKVIEPSGEFRAEITETNHFPVGTIGAGMRDVLTVYPTNVSFYRVELIELSCMPTNITGYCTNMDFDPVNVGYAPLDYENSCDDKVHTSFDADPPLYAGGWDVFVPTVWHVIGSSETNSFGILFSPDRLLGPNGDFSVGKNGITIIRSTNDVSHSVRQL
ncbi:MAG TPA: hypothetical protein VFW05_01755, partial [Verrucomicrobiae bacterium]|nr:hypothetical protein [Verrucomicrobiae bacterium]